MLFVISVKNSEARKDFANYSCPLMTKIWNVLKAFLGVIAFLSTFFLLPGSAYRDGIKNVFFTPPVHCSNIS